MSQPPQRSAAGALTLTCAAPGFVRLYSRAGQVLTVVDPEPVVCHQGFGDSFQALS
ncbi:hypothetical protein ACIBI9_18740 [Nonomuraea sp. NPDC050451]|uniref:hypothetical protein n=1 Tax=Nonomuraea sp. NPDC050451 TaxID=3364364 RepID=UPI003787C80E